MKIDENDYFAVIPARAGSKRIPNKHMQLIGEKTMIQFTIEAALESTELGSTIISSDASDIIKLAVEMGANAPFTRPHNLSTDNAMTTAVLKHALDWYKSHNDQYPNNIVLLQPTSPFRTANDIDQAIKLFRDSQKNRSADYGRSTAGSRNQANGERNSCGNRNPLSNLCGVRQTRFVTFKTNV